MEMKAPTTTAHPQPPSGGVYPTGPPTAGGIVSVGKFQNAVQIQVSLCAARGARRERDAAARLQFRGAQDSGRVLRRLPCSLAPAPTRRASHVAALQHFVGPGPRGLPYNPRAGACAQEAESALPAAAPSPLLLHGNRDSRLHELSGARPLARSRSPAPPLRHVTGGRVRPARRAPAMRRGWRRRAPRRDVLLCSIRSPAGLAPRTGRQRTSG